MIALSFVLRPTTAIFWLPLVLHHIHGLYSKRQLIRQLWLRMVPVASLVLVVTTLIDSTMYGTFVCVPWNFFLHNILSGVGDHYGTNPWHWYLSNGLPTLFTGLGLLPLFYGLFLSVGPRKTVLSFSLVWTVFVYSLVSHKEYRFLLPIIPLCCCFIAEGLHALTKTTVRVRTIETFVGIVLVLNVPLAIYLSVVHQRGTMDVISHLAATVNQEGNDGSSLLFLMPCHSTPYYSHLHQNVSMRFLTCEPNLGQENYVDEAEAFYSHPIRWLMQEYPEEEGPAAAFPNKIVLFDSLLESHETLSEFLLSLIHI